MKPAIPADPSPSPSPIPSPSLGSVSDYAASYGYEADDVSELGRPRAREDDDGRGHQRQTRSESPPRRPYVQALALYGTLKLLGFAVFMYLLDSSGDFRTRHPRFGGGAHVWDVLATWDGWWYRQIAENGYDPKLVPVPGGGPHWTYEQNSAAFFPLYPGLMRIVSDLTGLGSFGAGLVVSVLSSFVAAAGIYAVVVLLHGHRAALCAAGLFAVWPGSGVEWAVYSDSLFVALAAWTCHAVMTRRWLTAGLLCVAAGLSRPSSVPLIAAVGLSALIALWCRQDGIVRPLATMALAPLGLIGYIVWVGVKAGNMKAYFLLESEAWAHYVDWGSQTVHAIRSILMGHSDYDYAQPTEDLVALAVVIMAVVLLVFLITQRPPLVLTVMTVVMLVMTLTSHQIFGDISRYLLPAFPLMIPVATALARAKLPARATVLILTALASGSYAGYILFEIGIP